MPRFLGSTVRQFAGLSLFFALAALLAASPPALAAAVDCQADRSNTEYVLYLYFPTEQDDDFPSPMFGQVTAPLAAFDASDLDPDVGTTAQFRNEITERVKLQFCEFDVRVVQTTSDPNPSDDRWHVVGIGSDPQGGGFFGVCCRSNSSRVWAGEFLAASGNPTSSFFEALSDENSTLDRWANAIAGTTSHEAGHDSAELKLDHPHSAARPTEDAQQNHIMATGSVGNLTGEDRTKHRHFSDTSFELLAAAVGLYEQTLSNWDFINPNSSAADGLRITVLVLQDAGQPEISSAYDGGLSPWANASLSAIGTTVWQGDTYDLYSITFTEPQNWNNGGEGEIPAGEKFHVGVGLTKNYIVRDVTLTSGGSDMALHPRVVGYTPDGSFDPATGDYHLTLSVPDPENGPLIISDVRIRHLPRTVTINEMVETGVLIDIDGRSIVPWQSRTGEDIEVVTTANLPVANLAEPRAVKLDPVHEPECGSLPSPPPVPDHEFLDLPYCQEDPALGLFPSARVYVEATVTDPDARYFDRETGTMVRGPLSSRIFIQFSGQIPDLNGNGVDDAIDIDTGLCEDVNANGVCDHVEPARFKYPAKLLCGVQPEPSDGRLVKGHYATTINVLNLSDKDARITKTLSLTYPPEEQRPGRVVEIGKDTLTPGQALKVDCPDVERRIFPNGLPSSYIEGYVTIESITRIDVTGVYTSRDFEAAPPCRSGGYRLGHDDGRGCGTHGCDKHVGCCYAGVCPGAPALSTTLEIEQVREHLIEPPDEPRRPSGRADLVPRPALPPPPFSTEFQIQLPVGVPGSLYCGKSPPAGGPSRSVHVLVRNEGVGGAGASVTRVEFKNHGSVSQDTPALAAGDEIALVFDIPTGCYGRGFSGACQFTFSVDDTDLVQESDEENNNVSSLCLAPAG